MIHYVLCFHDLVRELIELNVDDLFRTIMRPFEQSITLIDKSQSDNSITQLYYSKFHEIYFHCNIPGVNHD